MLIMSFVKKIHYCWFGSEEPESVRKTVAHWQELNPDFEIIKWDENNTDVSAYEFGRRALRDRKWAYVADVVRLQKMIEQGGFYVDADVEMTSPLNRLEAYGDKLVMGYMLDCALGTAILYSPPDHPYLKDILAKYDHIRRDFYPRNNSVFTEYFINDVPGFLLDGKPFENGDCKIFQKEFFEQPAFIKSRGISIHHACGSWNKEEASPFAFGTGTTALQHALKWAKRQYRAHQMLHSNEFYDSYAAARKGERLPFDARKYYEPGE